MKLNHLNLIVTDVKAAVQFFESYFGFGCTSIKGDNVIAILIGEDGFTLVVMTSKEANQPYPDAFHLGFMLDTPEQIEEVYQKLLAGGISVGRAPAKIRDGYGFYFHFDSILIEVGLIGSR